MQGAAKPDGFKHYVGRSCTLGQSADLQDQKGRSVLGSMFQRLFASRRQAPVVQQTSLGLTIVASPFGLPALDHWQQTEAANRRKLVDTVLRQTSQEAPQDIPQEGGVAAATTTAAAVAAGGPNSHMFLLDISGDAAAAMGPLR